ncbi:MAG: hypothetical protein WCT18_04295 [Patescibacteria group bacterium]
MTNFSTINYRLTNLVDKSVFVFVLVAFVLSMFNPMIVKAEEPKNESSAIFVIAGLVDGEILLNLFSKKVVSEKFKSKELTQPEFVKFENKKDIAKVKRTYKVTATAYSSTPDQTDSTPCITANGLDVCKHNREDVIAANFLKFGTRVRIPDLYGDTVFTVADRMNPRYDSRIDLWMTSRERAIQFGKKNITIEVLD